MALQNKKEALERQLREAKNNLNEAMSEMLYGNTSANRLNELSKNIKGLNRLIPRLEREIKEQDAE